MRTATLLAMTLIACGRSPSADVLEAPPLTRAQALDNGAAADAILGQINERGMTASRTDRGSIGSVDGVAAGLANDQLWIADGANKRVLGYQAAASLGSGAPAEIVLNQDDFATIDYRNIPTSQQMVPTGVGVDHGGRVYVHDETNVLVYEDPFSDDAVADYELAGEPATIRSVRAFSLPNPLPSLQLLAVVGANAVVFYAQGSSDPFGEATISVPADCAGNAYDIAQGGEVYFLACSTGILCTDAMNTCSGIYAYEIDRNTGFIDKTATNSPALAYNDLAGAQSLHVESARLVVADTAGHRILSFDGATSHAAALLNTPGAPEIPVTDHDVVYGQTGATAMPDCLTTCLPNRGSTVSAQGLWFPTGLTVATDSRMWVTDRDNRRVLGYDNIASGNPTTNATVVLGQPDMSHSIANRIEGNSFATISGVAVGPVPGSLPRAAVVDTSTNRVLLYDDIGSYTTGDEPDHVLGQTDLVDYDSDLTANRLNGPTHVAIDSLGWVWVTDAGSARVLAYDSPATNAPATRVFGASNLTTGGIYADFGPLAVSGGSLFVGAGNRVFLYATTTPVPTPSMVFGQEQPTGALAPIANDANRGGGPRADTLSGVTGLAIDSDGRLWVADGANNRVLWFDNPSDTTNITESITADGVVGQPDFTSVAAHMGQTNANRYSFAGVSDVAITDDGTLWVSDDADHRVLAFFTPMEKDPVLGVPRADLVLGQADFATATANSAPNGINARTLNRPFAVSTDDSGRILLVSDLGNNRAVRYLRNRPPEVSGDGSYDVVRGESLTVTVTVTDPESDTIDIAPVNPYVAAVSGAPPLSVPVTYEAPADAPVGADTVITVVATDRGARPQQTTFTVVFHIIDRPTDPGSGTPPDPLPALDPETGCACAGGASAPAWLLLPLLALRRRRRRH